MVGGDYVAAPENPSPRTAQLQQLRAAQDEIHRLQELLASAEDEKAAFDADHAALHAELVRLRDASYVTFIRSVYRAQSTLQAAARALEEEKSQMAATVVRWKPKE
jgi:hypothetical protein